MVCSGERGAALLSVLLLVAVMATVAATALDRIGVATRLAGNAATLAQARLWLQMTEQLAAVRIEDMLAADQSRTTIAGGWLGTEQQVALPDGGMVRARLDDGSNCFNLNSLAEDRNGRLVPRPAGARQFVNLMVLLGLPQAEAGRIAERATSFLIGIGPSGPVADEAGEAAGRLIVDRSELRAVDGVSAAHHARLKPWLCALPTTDLAPINVNTLQPEQAPLIAMLDPDHIDLHRARAQLASRPSAGYRSVYEFWNALAFEGLGVSSEASRQVRVRSTFLTLRARVSVGGVDHAQVVHLDARETPVRVIARRFGEEG